MAEREKNKKFPSSQLRDEKGNTINPNYTNGLSDTVNPTAADVDFPETEYPIGVYVIPIAAGTVKVQLIDQEDGDSYTYSAVETNAYLGRPFEGRVRKIIATGSTSTGVKIVW